MGTSVIGIGRLKRTVMTNVRDVDNLVNKKSRSVGVSGTRCVVQPLGRRDRVENEPYITSPCE